MRRSLLAFVLLISVCGCVDSQGIYLPRFAPKPNVINDDRTNPSPGQFKPQNLYCLVMEDFQGGGTVSREQLNFIYGKKFRDLLKANCAKDLSGNPEYRLRIDKRNSLAGIWKELATPEPSEFPWLVLKNGDQILRRPLPKTWSELEPILNQYAGISK